MIILLSALSPVSLSAAELIFTIDYYHTINNEIIDRLRIMEEENEEQRQQIYTNLENADESSKRTLQMLLEILEWQQNRQYRNAFKANTRIFSQDFIIEENDSLYQGIMLPGGWLDVSFRVKARNRHKVPARIRVNYNGAEIFSGAQSVYPLDKLIMLHESYAAHDYYAELSILFLEITRCGAEICPPEVEAEDIE